MNIPTPAECVALMEQHAMLPNIRAHSLLVAQVAELLASGLHGSSRSGRPLPDMDLCITGALLHDIAKTPCLRNGGSHAKAGATICMAHGWPEIAEIVSSHVLLTNFAFERHQAGIFSAAEIVCYADKRVLHDVVVGLPERLEYILDKYGGGDERAKARIQENFRQCRQLEEALFAVLDFAPDQLANQLGRHESTFATDHALLAATDRCMGSEVELRPAPA